MFVCAFACTAVFAQGSYLYKTSLVRAAPGKLLELIAAYDKQSPQITAAGEQRPFIMRHSQGDQWDLLLLYPMEDYASYYQSSRIERRRAAGIDHTQLKERVEHLVSWQSDLFVTGPDLSVVIQAFDGASFFHVEIFRALPGKQAALYRQREMENAYLKGINRPQNLIFVADQGAPWDIYTMGFYRDIKHFAESADIPAELKEKAAVAAGFAGANRIGSYLRTLILEHHDTLAGPP